MMTSWIRQSAHAVLSRPSIGRLLAAVRKPRGVVLMLHRFRTDAQPTMGHDPAQLVALLTYLRAARVEVVGLDQIVDAYADVARPPKAPSVAFTVDDCYADLLDVAVPIFRRFDAPLTGFVVPAAVDRSLWYWWDHVHWLLTQAFGRRLALEIGGAPIVLNGPTSALLDRVELVCDRLKLMATADRVRAVDDLAAVVGVPLPTIAPPEYQVMTWDQLRTAERSGLRFGPHTNTHPVLSRCTDDESRTEILSATQRLRQELVAPSSVFCYPVGRRQDFGTREMRFAQEAGNLAAVSAVHGALLPGMNQRTGGDAWRWAVPRYPFDGRAGAAARLLFA
jgi:peptidoglycan/xylan/chitin deacetylase (PgdA/CDA1 family)